MPGQGESAQIRLGIFHVQIDGESVAGPSDEAKFANAAMFTVVD